MAEFRRPSRLILALLAVVLPALVGLACRGLIATNATSVTSGQSAVGVSIELPPAPSPNCKTFSGEWCG